ncbi:MAG: hypothetical protein LWX56_00195 [Ignavibacteria bacterium]|nr:hypothetical protein [Ignavibacteria bacterium]
MFKTIIFICLFCFCLYNGTFAQQSVLSQKICRLSAFVAEIPRVDRGGKDLLWIDSIYIQALKICDNDKADALLTLTFSLLPYNRVPIHIGLFGLKFNFPLFSADSEIYTKKNSKLPRRFLIDSPNDAFGDSDKLAHFFGSAFLTYEFRSENFCNSVGIFVELFEQAFTSEGPVSVPDLTADKLGSKFGKILREDEMFLPSRLLLMYNVLQLF